MAATTIEQRIAELQATVARRKAQSPGERYGVTGHTNPEAIEALFGVFKDDPDAEEVWHSIEAEREHQREEARRETETDTAK